MFIYFYSFKLTSSIVNKNSREFYFFAKVPTCNKSAHQRDEIKIKIRENTKTNQ